VYDRLNADLFIFDTGKLHEWNFLKVIRMGLTPMFDFFDFVPGRA